MKTLLFLAALLTFSSGYAKEISYSSAGVGTNGKTFAGNLSSKDNGSTVSGELVDEDGGSHDFKGKRDDHGNITGKTKDGIQVELSTE
ncbi:MAG: hypothetical protein JSR17_00045 [Proteobacteria bacterium]|nr:hypothetical protein [Pseudomonadota bacterium]